MAATQAHFHTSRESEDDDGRGLLVARLHGCVLTVLTVVGCRACVDFLEAVLEKVPILANASGVQSAENQGPPRLPNVREILNGRHKYRPCIVLCTAVAQYGLVGSGKLRVMGSCEAKGG